jgi:heme A synthase
MHSFAVEVHFAHRVWAVVVGVLVAACTVRAFRSRRPGLRKTAVGLSLLVAIQIALGAATVLTGKAVAVTTAHVAVGALLLAGTLVLCLSSLASERRRKNNVVPIRGAAIAGRASGWK